MKKLLRIIVITIIILVFITISIVAIYKLKIHILSKYKTYEVIVKSIRNNIITVETPRPTRYIISKNGLFYDVNENQISVSNLNVGDLVYIFDELANKKEEMVIRNIKDDCIVADTIYSIEYTFSASEEKIWDINQNITNISNLNVGDTVFVICKLTNKTEIAVIKNIEDNMVTVNIMCFQKYVFLSENTLLYDNNNNIINISELNVGDTAYIIEKLINKQTRVIVKNVKNNSVIADIDSKWYSFRVGEDTAICNSEGNQIGVSDLRVGDILNIICKEKINDAIAYAIEQLDNIKLIQLVNYKRANISD